MVTILKKEAICCGILGLAVLGLSGCTTQYKIFPALMPDQKPTDIPLSTAMARMYDQWNPLEDRDNELYSNFKYTRLKGLQKSPSISRRDPTKVIKVGDTYHVWYTGRHTEKAPVGVKKMTETIPGTDWDLSDIWHATSKDGWTWKEDKVPAVRRPAKPQQGYRSICTPGILQWGGKYYLYFQAYNKVGGQEYCPVRVAYSDSPDGPWTHHPEPVILPGPKDSWNNIKINDPCPMVVNGRILIYYKGAPIERGIEYVLRMQGVSFADNPLGPFVPSKVNPVTTSGHETCMFPWKDGVAALIALDGPEKNTMQYAPDGENFEIESLIQVPPVAPGPYCPTAFTDSEEGGRGFTWGLCHINTDGGSTSSSTLARFDCDLSLDSDFEYFKKNNLRFNQETYFQRGIGLPPFIKKQILKAEKEQQ